ncbi:YcaO-like family protein [Haloglomus litoreum]|uniref:YcaO-like family protein n=1 Tax=Haloglomus litoreum TaxID=3034026 RepID=UPI0023E80A62|nr:YcaO-like family protein [Haloglomus sp. DT116]
MSEVRLAGEGPATEAVAAALADTDATVDRTAPSELDGGDLGVVVAPVGAEAFETATGTAREAGTPWLAVELRGVGGHEIQGVDAAVGGFGAGTACFDCLRTRVAAGLGEEAAGRIADGTASVPPTTARFAGALAGRAAADLVAGRETATLGSVVEVPHAERQLLPVPGCACERDAPGPALDRTAVDRSLDESVDRLERAVDRRLGPVAEISEAESFPAPYYLSELAGTSGFSDGTTGGLAAGVAADWNGALGKALGEGLERYTAAVYRTADFERAPAAGVQGAVPPSAFVRPVTDGEDADGGWHAPDPSEPISWVAGEDLATRERAWLPAEFVVFPPPRGAHHRPAITTGLGFGSGVDALLSGLSETIERDAAMLAWYSTYEPMGLSVQPDALARAGEDGPLATFDTLRRRARSEGLETTALLLTQDVDVPVVACAVQRDGGPGGDSGDWPSFAAGMSADLDPAVAARDALAEALQNWMELRGMGRQGAAEQQPTVARAADLPRDVQAFCDPETTVPLGSVGPADPPTGAAGLDALLDALDEVGLDAYAARLTTRDVETLGFEAVRVLVPGAQPLFTGTPYFGERAREVPGTFGCESRLDRAHHPFP